MDYSEKRSVSRARINQLIGYYPNREEYLWAEGIDLSEGGIRCVSKEAVDPLMNVFIMIGVPTEEGEHLVRCEGFVAHSHMEDGRCVFGVRFRHIEEEDRPYLAAYLQELATRENQPTEAGQI